MLKAGGRSVMYLIEFGISHSLHGAVVWICDLELAIACKYNMLFWINLRNAVWMLSLIKTLIPVYHSIAFCLFCYTDKEAIGQVPGSGTWDKGDRQDMQKRPRVGQSGHRSIHTPDGEGWLLRRAVDFAVLICASSPLPRGLEQCLTHNRCSVNTC